MKQVHQELKGNMPLATNLTSHYTIIWFYVPGEYLLKKFKYAGATYYKAKMKLKELVPTAIEVTTNTLTGDILYYADTFQIEET